ncbi:MAG: FmdB family zinc ribbon protein [Thermodesulfobacteriota bacterium]
MPIYEYRCPDCEKVFEVMQKFSDDPVKECRFCAGKKVEKLISRSSFVLKGTGWYQSDYARKPIASSSPPSSKAASGEAKPACEGCPSAKSGD